MAVAMAGVAAALTVYPRLAFNQVVDGFKNILVRVTRCAILFLLRHHLLEELDELVQCDRFVTIDVHLSRRRKLSLVLHAFCLPLWVLFATSTHLLEHGLGCEFCELFEMLLAFLGREASVAIFVHLSEQLLDLCGRRLGERCSRLWRW